MNTNMTDVTLTFSMDNITNELELDSDVERDVMDLLTNITKRPEFVRGQRNEGIITFMYDGVVRFEYESINMGPNLEDVSEEHELVVNFDPVTDEILSVE